MRASNLGNYYEEFTVGETVDHALSKTIFESDNNLFCLLTMNHHPVHLNEHFSQQHHHGKILVVGTLVFSIVVGITVPDISGKAVANLEYESVVHLGPVFIGDTIYARSRIIDKWMTSDGNRGVVYVQTNAYNHDGERILSLKRKVLVPKRPLL